MKELTYLSIKKPCHEGWENMSLSEKGRFCSSCKKEVHDFSNSTLEQIRQAYSENKDGLCGHVSTKLLQEQHFEKHLYSGHFSHLKKFWIAAVFCFGASLFTVDAAKASTFYKIRTTLFNFATENKDTIIVKGIVQDRSNKEKLPFIEVKVYYKDSVVSKGITDIDGVYQVKIPKQYENVDIKVAYIGYLTKIVKGIILSPDKQIIVDFDLEQDEMYITDGIMIMDEPVKKTKSKKK